jgi:hypothetical protein
MKTDKLATVLLLTLGALLGAIEDGPRARPFFSAPCLHTGFDFAGRFGANRRVRPDQADDNRRHVPRRGDFCFVKIVLDKAAHSSILVDSRASIETTTHDNVESTGRLH